MPMVAPYDEIADWYESVFLARQRHGAGPSGYADALGIDQALVEMLGQGDGLLLELAVARASTRIGSIASAGTLSASICQRRCFATPLRECR